MCGVCVSAFSELQIHWFDMVSSFVRSHPMPLVLSVLEELRTFIWTHVQRPSRKVQTCNILVLSVFYLLLLLEVNLQQTSHTKEGVQQKKQTKNLRFSVHMQTVNQTFLLS